MESREFVEELGSFPFTTDMVKKKVGLVAWYDLREIT
jgi:hypothetical protein